MSIDPQIIVFIVTVLIVLGISAVIYWYLPRKKTRVKDLYTEGLDMLVTGHRKKAYQNFLEIVRRDTENVNAYIKLGQVVREGGNPRQALKIHKSLTLRKNLTEYEQVELHKNLALDYYDLKQLEDAILEAKNILQIDKKNDWALKQLVIFTRENGDWGTAGDYLSQLMKLKGISDNRKLGLYKIQEGRMAMKNSEYDKAVKHFNDALKISDSLAEAYFFQGNVFAAESEEAFRRAQSFAEKSPQSNKDKKLHKQAMDEAKEYLAKAITNWSRFAEMDPDHAWLVISKLRDGLFALERFDEIESILKKILEKNPENMDALTSLANYYFQKGDINETIELLERVLDIDGTSITANLIRLKINIQKNDQRSLLQDIDRLIDLMYRDESRYKQRKERDSDLRWIFESSGDLENFTD